eukprot:jgi/Psemu1/304361/fgenesh1_kg.148_\
MLALRYKTRVLVSLFEILPTYLQVHINQEQLMLKHASMSHPFSAPNRTTRTRSEKID